MRHRLMRAARHAGGRCLIACCLGCWWTSAADAQPQLEETEFAGWTTVVSGLLDRTVSGAPVSSGGNPGAHYLVRHTHRLFQTYSTSVVSASFAPIAVDPSSLGLAQSPRFSIDLRFEPAAASAPGVSANLTWVPLLEQDGVVYRQFPEVLLGASWERAEQELSADGWTEPNLRAPDLSAGAAPVRIGVLLQTDYVVPPGQQHDVLVHVDNVRIQGFGPISVSLAAVPSPAGGHVVFAPPECFDGLPDERRQAFHVHASASAELLGCVDFEAPGLRAVDDSSTAFCFVPGLGETNLGIESSVELVCEETAPTFVELLPIVESSPPASLGIPSRARVEPCMVRVAGGNVSCNQLGGVCPVEAAFGLLCSSLGQGSPCYFLDLFATAPQPELAVVSSATASSAEPIETLRRVRDEVMGPSVAGRYYRDLYDAFSTELRELLLGDLRIVRDVFATAPAWLEVLGALVDGSGSEAQITGEMASDMLAIFDRFESKASPALREVFRRERERLRLEETTGLSIADAAELVEQRGGPPPCATSAESLCLQGGRFRVEVTWSDGNGGAGAGRAVALSSDSGWFWFFDDANVELVVKVLDGRTINDRYWVFYGALSDVEYTVLVTDTSTGALRAYRNPRGVFASVGDTGAFTEDGAPREEVAWPADEGASWLSRIAGAATEVLRGGWDDVRRLLRAGGARLPSPALELAPAGGFERGASVASTCVAGANALCLAGARFRVEVEWRDFSGGSGVGRASPLTSDTGTFWFFDAANTELIVKVLDARSINGHFWVYYGALSNVEYTLRVTDTATGLVRTYENPAGAFASHGDVEAF